MGAVNEKRVKERGKTMCAGVVIVITTHLLVYYIYTYTFKNPRIFFFFLSLSIFFMLGGAFYKMGEIAPRFLKKEQEIKILKPTATR